MGNRLARLYIQSRCRSPLLLPFLGLGLGLLSCGVTAQGRMPRGSYLEHQAKTMQELNRELDDPVVIDRYAKLFNMPPAMVRLAFADLKLQPLREDRNMEVWFVKPGMKGEVLGYRLHKVKKGTLVFAQQDGTPVLIQACGNPVRMIPLPLAAQVDLSNLPVYNDYPSLVLGGKFPGIDAGHEVNVDGLDAMPDDFVEVSIPDVQMPLPVEPKRLLEAQAKRSLALWLSPLIALIPRLGGGGGGGGGESSFNPLPLPPPSGSGSQSPVYPSAVPEPGTVTLLGGFMACGAAYLLARRRRK